MLMQQMVLLTTATSLTICGVTVVTKWQQNGLEAPVLPGYGCFASLARCSGTNNTQITKLSLLM
jgi:hypothetical protein